MEMKIQYIAHMHACITVIAAVHKGALQLHINVCNWMYILSRHLALNILTVKDCWIVLRMQNIH